jgi:ABC-type transporter Mla MlaB component
MPEQQLEKHQAGVYGVTGDLTFDSVVHVELEGLQAIRSSRQGLVFDLSAVQKCSSAALALLLSWVRASKAQGLDVSFKAPPSQLQTMVQNAHLQAIINIIA